MPADDDTNEPPAYMMGELKAQEKRSGRIQLRGVTTMTVCLPRLSETPRHQRLINDIPLQDVPEGVLGMKCMFHMPTGPDGFVSPECRITISPHRRARTGDNQYRLQFHDGDSHRGTIIISIGCECDEKAERT